MIRGSMGDRQRAIRLALAVLDDDQARYDAVLLEWELNENPLIWSLVDEWVLALTQIHGTRSAARTYLESELFSYIENGNNRNV